MTDPNQHPMPNQTPASEEDLTEREAELDTQTEADMQTELDTQNDAELNTDTDGGTQSGGEALASGNRFLVCFYAFRRFARESRLLSTMVMHLLVILAASFLGRWAGTWTIKGIEAFYELNYLQMCLIRAILHFVFIAVTMGFFYYKEAFHRNFYEKKTFVLYAICDAIIPLLVGILTHYDPYFLGSARYFSAILAFGSSLTGEADFLRIPFYVGFPVSLAVCALRGLWMNAMAAFGRQKRLLQRIELTGDV